MDTHGMPLHICILINNQNPHLKLFRAIADYSVCRKVIIRNLQMQFFYSNLARFNFYSVE